LTADQERILFQHNQNRSKFSHIFFQRAKSSEEKAENEWNLSHCTSVVWMLNQSLLRVANIQQRLQEKRLQKTLNGLER
jgi:hypothetical protein